MDSSKSKSTKILRKLTSPDHKHTDLFADISNVRMVEPRRSSKQLPKHLTRDHSKKVHTKNYLLNKTTFGTPNEKSFNA